MLKIVISGFCPIWFHCNFWQDIAYLSLYQGYRYIEDCCIGVPLYKIFAFEGEHQVLWFYWKTLLNPNTSLHFVFVLFPALFDFFLLQCKGMVYFIYKLPSQQLGTWGY